MKSWIELNLVASAGVKNQSGEEIANKLFGYIKKNNNEGCASFLVVNDAAIADISTARERRHGIAIEASSGTAREHFFYTRALLPKGTKFYFSMELDVNTGDKETVLGALTHLLEALTTGEIRFGSNKTRGFGAMKLVDMKVYYYDFNIDGAFDKWLDRKPSDNAGIESLGGYHGVKRQNADQKYSVVISWAPVSKIMVKSGRDGIETDMLPLMTGTDKGLVPVIPGSSIKGVLRSQACRVMRTIFGQDPNAQETYLDIVNDMFGDGNNSGRVFIDDVYLSETGVSYDDWINESNLDRITVHEDHVAIDRFTGGASEGALYSARPVPKTVTINDIETKLHWTPIKITIDFSARLKKPDETSRLAELALLELLIRDMREGLIPIGFGTNRGLGDIEISDVKRDADYMQGAGKDKIKQAWKKFIDSEGSILLGWRGKKMNKANLKIIHFEDLLTLTEAMEKPMEEALGEPVTDFILAYSPTHCGFANWNNSTLEWLDGTNVNDFYEVRAFGEKFELRWVKDASDDKGRTTILQDSGADCASGKEYYSKSH
jgi:CRISPR/Cas system CSM-associated protein Csm3 (group 7 of RAMP superfamily)